MNVIAGVKAGQLFPSRVEFPDAAAVNEPARPPVYNVEIVRDNGGKSSIPGKDIVR